MSDFFVKELSDIRISDLIDTNSVIVGLDIGDKTVGVSVSDRRIKIASGVTTIARKGTERDFKLIEECLKNYKVGLVVFGWPVQMNGCQGKQCEKILDFIQKLSSHIHAEYAKWDERFSTSVVSNIMIQADLSRKKRKKVIDKGAAIYILQGAIDFLNHQNCTI